VRGVRNPTQVAKKPIHGVRVPSCILVRRSLFGAQCRRQMRRLPRRSWRPSATPRRARWWRSAKRRACAPRRSSGKHCALLHRRFVAVAAERHPLRQARPRRPRRAPALRRQRRQHSCERRLWLIVERLTPTASPTASPGANEPAPGAGNEKAKRVSRGGHDAESGCAARRGRTVLGAHVQLRHAAPCCAHTRHASTPVAKAT